MRCSCWNPTKAPTFSPGFIAFRAAGIAGAVCVVIAGWTTANPTIYRAGLALQTLNPKFKTWKVTLFTGLITTGAACFPALVMRLLDFVALYGLILMPMGAVIFIDFYLVKPLNLRPFYAESSGRENKLGGGSHMDRHACDLPVYQLAVWRGDIFPWPARLVRRLCIVPGVEWIIAIKSQIGNSLI